MTVMGFDCLRAPVTVMSPIAHVQEGWEHLGCGSPAGACFLTLARFSGIQYRVAQRHIVQHNSDSYATSFSTTGCFCDYLCPQNTQPGQGPPCSMSKTRSRQWPSCSPLCAEAGEGELFHHIWVWYSGFLTLLLLTLLPSRYCTPHWSSAGFLSMP